MNPFHLVLTQKSMAEAPASAVWEVFADIERWPHWNRVCESVQVLGGEPWNPGFRFHMVLRMAGRRVPFEPTVMACDPGRRVVWSSKRMTVTGTRTFTFAEAGEARTEMVDEKQFTSPVLPVRLFYPRPVINRMSQGWLDSLATEAALHAAR